MKRYKVVLMAVYTADVWNYYVDAESRSQALRKALKEHASLKRPAAEQVYPDDIQEM